VAKERKRLRALEQILTAEEALVFASVLADVVKGLVNDRDVLKAIALDWQSITTIPESGNGRRRE